MSGQPPTPGPCFEQWNHGKTSSSGRVDADAAWTPLRGMLFEGEGQSIRICLGCTTFALHLQSLIECCVTPNIFSNVVCPHIFWSLNLTPFFGVYILFFRSDSFMSGALSHFSLALP